MESRSGIQAFSLQGKTAVVTGARSGIGQAIAIGLAQAGADLILWGGRGGLDETAKAVSDLGRLAGTTEADLTDQDSVDRAASEILAGHEVEILVNSAGMIRRGPAVDAPMEG
ncbi:MAG TPA: SDR family NAD(P)-dependent oxidoreductase, partial [Candidatus Dormibacteraeota bacterium]|nr:SDR family NAD(P)-dependent oxidoreductase [Candidatus Dormibacteraeota bacterium]